jgi:hypothetical protein
MQKLQDTIDNLYLDISQKPRSLVPSDAVPCEIEDRWNLLAR